MSDEIIDPNDKVIDFDNEKAKRILIRKCQRTEEFARIWNGAVEDTNLKDSELAVLVYIMKQPATWTVEPYNINARFGWDIKKTYKVLNELKRLGYMRRIRERNPNGTLGKWFTEVSDEPIFLHLIEKTPESEKGIVVESTPESEKRIVVENQPQSVFPLSGETDCGHLIRQRKETIVFKETTTNNLIENPEDKEKKSAIFDVIVSLKEISIEPEIAIRLANKHSKNRIDEVIQAFKDLGEKAKSPGWVVKALELGWSVTKSSLNAPNLSLVERTQYSRRENQMWWRSLLESQKLELYNIAKSKWSPLDYNLEQEELVITDIGFDMIPLFGTFLELIGRPEKKK